MRKWLAPQASKPHSNNTKKVRPYAKLVRMSLLLGIMCVFVACSTPANAPVDPNLVLTVAPGAASVEVDGVSAVTMLSQQETSLQSSSATVTNFLVQPGSYYTVNVKAPGRADFSKKYWLRDGRKLNLKVGLARKGGRLPEGGYAEAFEAEDAKISSSLNVQEGDSGASRGSYLVQPSEISNTEAPRKDAHFNFFAPEDGTYTLWARMYASTDADDAYYLGFNDDFARTYPQEKGKYVWVEVARSNLKAGGNRISIGHAEAGARLDLLFVTNKSLGKTELDEFITVVEESETDIGAPTPAPTPSGTYALRGNPNFAVNSLNPEQRKWYDRLWGAINNPNQYPNSTKMAKSDDIYKYRGDLQGYISSLMNAFRITGDLRLLDEMDRVAQLMRQELDDSWRDTKDGTNGTRDGFVNWVNRYDTTVKYMGKDVHVAYDLKAHALVSMIAWTLENNRDLRSPSGVNYGAHADFWKDYLVNDFEAKWRKREGKASGFPFVMWYSMHTYHSWMKWHYYMGKLTGNNGYTRQAEKMADVLWQHEFKEVSSEYGTAIVFARGILSYLKDIGGSPFKNNNYLIPQHYARYIIQESVDLHFEGFHNYANPANIEKFARSLSAFMMDKDDFSSFGRDIGGGKTRAGLVSNTSWTRMDQNRFSESSWSFLAAWDTPDGRIAKASQRVYSNTEGDVNQPRKVFIAAGMFMKESLGR